MKKLKLMQISTLYNNYLSKLYTDKPSLKQISYIEQIETIWKDGFGASHMIAKHLGGIGYDSQLIIANCQSAQLQWLKENSNIKSLPSDWQNEVTRLQVENFKPDILYLLDSVAFDSRFINSLSYRPKLVIGWRTASIPEGTDWTAFDLILSFHKLIRERALLMGVKATEHFYPGFPEWILPLINDVQPSTDVVFCGSWYSVHKRRNTYWEQVAENASDTLKGFSLRFFLLNPENCLPEIIVRYNQGNRYGIDMHRVLRIGRINLNAGGDVFNGKSSSDLSMGDSINMRLFEATGSGTFLLTEFHENLYQYFKPGQEIETFCNGEELIDKIRFYLANPSIREKIAKRGQEKCLTKHSMKQRAMAFNKIITKYLE